MTHEIMSNSKKYTEIIPKDSKITNFSIYEINIDVKSDIGLFELIFYYGDTNIECSRMRFNTNIGINKTYGVWMSAIPAKSKIQARLWSVQGDKKLIFRIKIFEEVKT